MKRYGSVLGLVLLLAAAVVGCEGPTATTGYQPSAAELAVRETEQALATRSALAAVARATSDALALSEQATRQAQNAQATRQALDAQATRQAQNAQATAQAATIQATEQAQARSATATTEAIRATATAESRRATATIQARADAAQATQVQATAQAVARLDRREMYLEPIRAVGLLLMVLAGLAGLAGLIVYLLPILNRRLSVIRRDAGEGEPMVLMERGPNGEERIGLPLRAFRAILDGGEPVPDDRQEAATMRQQSANALQARQAGQIAAAKHGRPRVIMPMSQGARREYDDPRLPPIHVSEANDRMRPLIEDVRGQIEDGTIEGEL